MIEQYDPTAIEQKWYQFWESEGFFKPNTDDNAEPYCIMIPPPNVTGTLHMGHAFQDTIMDALIRYHRMLGKKTLWQAGTDHAGIATQMVVERQLNRKGLSRLQMSREDFLEKVWEWKQTSGGSINQQLRRLGTSLDWSRERFTMDPGLSKAVHKVFVDLYNEKLIYRGQRLVNWDPELNTALSDLEVESHEEQGHMWHLKYVIADADNQPTKNYLVVATTRPETLFGDTAVAVNPKDEKHNQWIGKKVILPLSNRCIPVIGDSHADPEKGTGCVKITPAHDFNDYEVGKRHNLPFINILNKDATLNNKVPEAYQNMDRYKARDIVVADLQKQGHLIAVEKHKLMVPRGDRSGVVVEPLLTNQWYVDAKTLAQPAIKAVKNDDIRFIPDNWKNTYYSWMNDIQDWCISRQLWWGHRIPAWYDEQNNIYVGLDETDVRTKHRLSADIKLTQDTDVLDTWFSSALWPFATLGWPEKTPELKTYYPTSVLVTGFDIIFFWVARMIMMGLKFMKDIPFKEIYIHGLVRDSQGQKMSKSKGNVLDPIDLIDGIGLDQLLEKRTYGLMQNQPERIEHIKKATREEFPEGIKSYGCDALRFTYASLASTGRDINFDIGRIEGYRNFCNKIFNAARFVLINTEDYVETQPKEHILLQRWINTSMHQCLKEYHKNMKTYRLDLASHNIYDFFWNTYCDWFLEFSKPLLKGKYRPHIQYTLLNILEMALKLLHPFMPFITEEIWQTLKNKLNRNDASIMVTRLPDIDQLPHDQEAMEQIKWLQSFIVSIRQIRSEMDIQPSKRLNVMIQNHTTNEQKIIDDNIELLQSVGKIEKIESIDGDYNSPATTALIGDMKIFIPLAGNINLQEEQNRIEKQLKKLEQEIKRCTGKLNNEKFVKNAPDQLVTAERKKLEDYEQQYHELGKQLEKVRLLSM